MTSFYWTCFASAQAILRALALGIGLDDDTHLLHHHSGHHNQLRLLHYPPIPAEAVEAGKFARMPAHTDWSTVTLLFQDDCGGLQVEDPARAGEFVDVPPVPGTCVMNVGDLLMRWSNGELSPGLPQFHGGDREPPPPFPPPSFFFLWFGADLVGRLVSRGRLPQVDLSPGPTPAATGPVFGQRQDDARAVLDSVLRHHGSRSGG